MKKVTFRFFKEAMDFSTNKAQLIKLGNRQDPIKVWLPLSQIEVEEDSEDENYNVITMPEWLLKKNSIIMDYAEVTYA